MTPIFLIRHGETELNVARVLQPAGTTLSARGVDQAEALAARLAGEAMAGVVSSDLPRALRTAAAIAAPHGLAVETTPLLQERNYGQWRGLAYDRLPADPLTMPGAPPGGESAAAFEARVAAAFAFIVRRAAALGGPLAVVTHGLVIRALLAAHLRLGDGMTLPGRLGNTGLTVFGARPPHLVSRLDCTRHLGAAARDDANALSGG